MCSFLYFFFFFKQKTAYEMRISDWSSDVCSSDLGRRVALPLADRPTAEAEHFQRTLDALRIGCVDARGGVRIDARQFGMQRRPAALTEIGRASCRERVCQYV